MTIRLHGTAEECEEAVRLLGQVMAVRSVSEPYPDRGRSVLVRVYVEAVPQGARRAAAAIERIADGGQS